MRRLIWTISLIVALLVPVAAQIDVVRVEQYKTKVGWRLYFLTSNPYMWPLTEFKQWELAVSDEMMGYHPPYIGAMMVGSDQNYTDPEFTLLAPLPPGEYYYRLSLYTTGGLFSQTNQQTFIIGDVSQYHFIVPYVCEYEPFHTAIALETKDDADIIVEVYNQSNEVTGFSRTVDGLTFIWLSGIVDAGFVGSLQFSSTKPFRYTVLVLNGDVAAITYTGGVQ